MAAYHVAERIPVVEVPALLPASKMLSQTVGDVVFQFDVQAWCFVYSFGSVVFFNVPADEQIRVVRLLRAHSPALEGESTSDDFEVVVIPGEPEKVQFDRVQVDALELPKVEILALVLAQSATLEYYEVVVEDLLDRAEMATNIMKTGRLPGYNRSAIVYIGMSLSTRRDLISRLYIFDAPDITWENSALDRLFTQMKNTLDIDVRYRALEYKLKLIQEGVQVIVDLTNAKRNIMLEVTIVILIVVEILLALHVIH